MKVAVVGGGAFGSAMACAARRAGLDVALWARETEVVDAVNSRQENPLFLKGIALEHGISAHSNLEQVIASADFVLLAVPAQFLRTIAMQMRPALRSGIPIVSCSKGIEQATCALMPEVIAQTLPEATVAVLAGPSFAAEVALGLTTAVTLACADAAVAAHLAGALGSEHFRVYTSTDPISATIGGAFKNVLAIACGIALARKMGENMRGLLIARGLNEMCGITRAKGGDPFNLLGLAGCGDVTLTCMGTQSRNTSFGIALGQGQSAREILSERKVVTEGVHNAASITQLGARLQVRVPIANAINKIVHQSVAIDDAFQALLGEPVGPELSLK